MTNLSTPKFLKDPQNIIAVGVTVISLCALIVSLIQTRLLHEERELIREQSRASVWPHLEFNASKRHNKKDYSLTNFALTISNSGVGPAIITDVKICYKDSVAKNWWHLFKLQNIPDSIETFINNRSFNKLVLPAGKTLEILNLNNNLPLANAFYKQSDSVSIEIYYKSVYGEKWKWESGTTTRLETFDSLPAREQFY